MTIHFGIYRMIHVKISCYMNHASLLFILNVLHTFHYSAQLELFLIMQIMLYVSYFRSAEGQLLYFILNVSHYPFAHCISCCISIQLPSCRFSCFNHKLYFIVRVGFKIIDLAYKQLIEVCNVFYIFSPV